MKINKNIENLKPSATLRINEYVKELRIHKQKVFHFGFGQSPFSIPKPIVKSLQKNAHRNQYLPTTGLVNLKQAISYFLKNHQGIDTQAENIFIGPGSKELLYQSILVFEGTFLIPKASWVSYLPQIKAAGKKAVILQTKFENNYKLQPEVIEQYLKNKTSKQHILILNSPNNPTGAVYSSSELENLAIVCKKYGVIIFSDEIYSQLPFTKKHAVSISTFYPEKTIVFGGLSKVFSAGGYRLGFMVIPDEMIELKNAYCSLFSETFSAVSTPVQFAATKAFMYPNKIRNSIKTSKKILKTIGKYVFNKLESTGIRCTEPQGGFYLLISFDSFKMQLKEIDINTSNQLARYILDKYQVALLPGTDFYFSENEYVFRLAYVDFNGKKALKKYKKYKGKTEEEFVENLASKVYKGVQELINFTNNLVRK